MSRPQRRRRDPDASPRETLLVEADLRLVVTAPDGRSAELRVEDDRGTLRVGLARAADLRVVGASLPGGARGVAAQAARLVRQGRLPLPPWDQTVEVAVGSRVVLRRHHGRWSPGARPTARTAAVAGASLVALGVAVVLAGRLRRR